MGVAYDGGIEVFYNGCDVRLDLVRYPTCAGTSCAGFPRGRAALGRMALWLFRALYRDHLAPIKYNGVFLRCRVCQIHFLLLAHRLDVSDSPFREVRLMSTIALEG